MGRSGCVGGERGGAEGRVPEGGADLLEGPDENVSDKVSHGTYISPCKTIFSLQLVNSKPGMLTRQTNEGVCLKRCFT